MPNSPILISSTGDLLSTTTEGFRFRADSALEAASQYPDRSIEIDLRLANMIDSVGLNAIVAVIRKAKQHARNIKILVNNPHVYRVLVFTRIDRQASISLQEHE